MAELENSQTQRPAWLPHWQAMVITCVGTIILAAATTIITANRTLAVQDNRLTVVEVAQKQAQADAVGRAEMLARFDALAKQNEDLKQQVVELRTAQADNSRQQTEIYRFILTLKR
jgi:hypothetical protein